MGVYIKGMTLGELNDCIMAGAYIAPEEAVEVTKPHGNLIDYNFVYDELEKICTRCRSVGADRIDPKCGICWVNDFLSILNTAPTVIEAEGE